MKKTDDDEFESMGLMNYHALIVQKNIEIKQEGLSKNHLESIYQQLHSWLTK